MKALLQFFRQPEANAFQRLVSLLIAGASWLSVLLLFATMGSAYISPTLVPWTSVLGLAFPLALSGSLFMLVVSLLFAPRRCWIPIVGLLLASKSIAHYFPLHPFSTPDDAQADLRVMSYNTLFLGSHATEDSLMLDYFRTSDADIIALQEVVKTEAFAQTLQAFSQSSPYRYYAQADSSTQGLTLLSRYPIVRSQRITINETNGVWAHWLALPHPTRGKPQEVIVVNAHLKSNAISHDEREEIHKIVQQNSTIHEDVYYHTARSVSQKIGTSSSIRAAMADTLATFIRAHSHTPLIVVGDFNDTPISYAYRQMLEAGLKSAYAERGFGLGRSFNRDGIVVRIDHGFVSTDFDITAATIDSNVALSDHNPLRFALRWRKP